MAREVRHSLPDKVTFAMLVTLIVVATLAYGTVHQPALILFYLVVTVAGLTVAVDGLVRGELRFSRHPLQLPLLGAVVYAFIQLIPFGTRDAVAGVEGISRTISIEPFWTQMFALHLIALLAFFSVLLVLIDSAARLRALVMTLTVFGFLLAFFGFSQPLMRFPY